MSNPFIDVQASLFAWCKGFADDMRAADIADLEIFKFDAYADASDMPDKDVIGIGQYEIEVDGVVTADFMLGISTINDINTFRLDRLVGEAHARLKPDTVLPLWDAETAQQYGHLKTMSPQRVFAPEKTKQRAFRAIGLRVGSDRALT